MRADIASYIGRVYCVNVRIYLEIANGCVVMKNGNVESLLYFSDIRDSSRPDNLPFIAAHAQQSNSIPTHYRLRNLCAILTSVCGTAF